METLNGQGIKNGQQILAIILKDTAAEVKEAEGRLREIEDVKADTHLLASVQEYYMEV